MAAEGASAAAVDGAVAVGVAAAAGVAAAPVERISGYR